MRAYLGEQPLEDLHDELTSVASATSHLAAGHDDEAVRILEPAARPETGRSAAVALLALSYLLRDDRVEADDEAVRCGISAART